MCWTSSKYNKILTAKEDIKVFKIVETPTDNIRLHEKNGYIPPFTSLYQQFIYDLGRTYKATMNVIKTKNGYIHP